MRMGIDLGGTKIAAVVLDDRGETRWERRVATPRDDYDGTIAAIADLVVMGESAVEHTCSVGVGMPGTISPATGLVKNANSTWLNGRAFGTDLTARLGRPVRFANDANCLAVSESIDGAADGAAVVFGVILGTGVGGGIAIGGRAHVGLNAIAGEWGHNPLPWPEADERPGPPCYCGRSGCIEMFLSGPGLASDYRRRGGEALAPEAIVQRAGSGDPRARAAIDVWHGRLARGLAAVINLLDPDVIVLGGGLSRLDGVAEAVVSRWAPWVFSDRVDTRLVVAEYGDASGVRGAAWLWERGRVPC